MRTDHPEPVSPALMRHLQERGKRRENRAADQITRFAGSMKFVYIHVIWFSLWIGLGVEDYPFGLLTMIVSLEAIFLSTFVMISQNRADEKRQVIADEHGGQSRRRSNRTRGCSACPTRSSISPRRSTRRARQHADESSPSSVKSGTSRRGGGGPWERGGSPLSAAFSSRQRPTRQRYLAHRSHPEALRVLTAILDRQRLYPQGPDDGPERRTREPRMASAGVHGIPRRRVARENDQESRDEGSSDMNRPRHPAPRLSTLMSRGWRPVEPPRRPVLFVNPRSGDGAATRNRVVERATRARSRSSDPRPRRRPEDTGPGGRGRWRRCARGGGRRRVARGRSSGRCGAWAAVRLHPSRDAQPFCARPRCGPAGRARGS